MAQREGTVRVPWYVFVILGLFAFVMVTSIVGPLFRREPTPLPPNPKASAFFNVGDVVVSWRGTTGCFDASRGHAIEIDVTIGLVEAWRQNSCLDNKLCQESRHVMMAGPVNDDGTLSVQFYPPPDTNVPEGESMPIRRLSIGEPISIGYSLIDRGVLRTIPILHVVSITDDKFCIGINPK